MCGGVLPSLQDVVFSGVSAVCIGIGFLVTAANAADFQSRNPPQPGPRDSAAAASVSVCLSVCLMSSSSMMVLYVCAQAV